MKRMWCLVQAGLVVAAAMAVIACSKKGDGATGGGDASVVSVDPYALSAEPETTLAVVDQPVGVSVRIVGGAPAGALSLVWEVPDGGTIEAASDGGGGDAGWGRFRFVREGEFFVRVRAT